MTISPKIYTFPTIPIERQLFHVPGAAFDGGLTSGGAQIVTPEPGGFAVLEIEPSLQDGEWSYPSSSWVMSKTNGQIFRVRLAPSPQVAYSKKRGMTGVPWDTGLLWSNQEMWDGDFSARYSAPALKGTTTVEVDLTGVGQILEPGHVFGHAFESYIVDEVSYSGDVATVTFTPPLRRNVSVDDQCPLRPWFTGRISMGDFRSPYNHLGHVKMGNIVLHEAIVP